MLYSMLAASGFLGGPLSINVYFEPAVPPLGTDFASMLRLRDQVRTVILASRD